MFHQRRTDLKQEDFPFSATFSGEVVWGRYNLTRYDNIRPHQ